MKILEKWEEFSIREWWDIVFCKLNIHNYKILRVGTFNTPEGEPKTNIHMMCEICDKVHEKTVDGHFTIEELKDEVNSKTVVSTLILNKDSEEISWNGAYYEMHVLNFNGNVKIDLDASLYIECYIEVTGNFECNNKVEVSLDGYITISGTTTGIVLVRSR